MGNQISTNAPRVQVSNNNLLLFFSLSLSRFLFFFVVSITNTGELSSSYETLKSNVGIGFSANGRSRVEI